MIATATIERVSQSIHEVTCERANWSTIPEQHRYSILWQLEESRDILKKQSFSEEKSEANRTLQSPAAALQLILLQYVKSEQQNLCGSLDSNNLEIKEEEIPG